MAGKRITTEPAVWKRALWIYGHLCGYLVVAALWIIILARQPLRTIDARDPVAVPPYPAWISNPAPQAWVVVSRPGSLLGRRDSGFPGMDCGRFWVNIVSHELGSARLVAPDVLEQPVPDHVRVLIVSARAQFGVAQRLPVLEAFVREGGCLFLERPGPPLLSLAGVARQLPGTASGVQLTLVHDTAVLKGLEVVVDRIVLADRATAAVLGRVVTGDSASEVPVVWRNEVGRGVVVGIAMDMARTFVGRVQGTPEADFTFRPRERDGALAGIPVPADMVADFPEPEAPVLDRLERVVWGTALERVIVPGWWPFPGGAPAAYLCSHDEEGFGDRSLFMIEEEARRREASTTFVLPEPMTRNGLSRIRALGGEVVLHWHRGFGGGNTREKTLGPLVVVRQALDLAEQQRILRSKGVLPLPPITRIHGLQWDGDFDTTFRRMVAAGIRMDSTYGPFGTLGPYLFGSLQPFRPLDRTGTLLPILELPFALQDDEAAPMARLWELVAVAAELHLPVVPIFHTNTMSYKPGIGPLEAWLEGFEWAREHHFWRGTMGRYLAFLEGRERSVISASRRRSPEVVEVEAFRDDLWVRVPARSPGGRLEGIDVDGMSVGDVVCVNWGRQVLALAAVPRGKHRVRLFYGTGEPVCGPGSR